MSKTKKEKEKNPYEYLEYDKYTWRRMANFFWSCERDPDLPTKENKKKN